MTSGKVRNLLKVGFIPRSATKVHRHKNLECFSVIRETRLIPLCFIENGFALSRLQILTEIIRSQTGVFVLLSETLEQVVLIFPALIFLFQSSADIVPDTVFSNNCGRYRD